MSSDDRFWISVWGIIGTVFIIVMLFVFGNMAIRTNAIVKLVQSGVSPIEAKYAIRETGVTEDALFYITSHYRLKRE